ncbi:hypothetical protein SLH49_17875 [Cognatiyoonia sp. IB215446]|uniref:hypothetical protein n=1 Tax=Cognatiyoonia sp. IB215446 TaxID=3097355 RepID=UPI002A1545F9|nr:hypothetical protein [Cognatiyoonia sp. IB215446]MDX8349859.1 hypothetical protein [Cognatiyoonia sp. IB215446]
MSIRALQTLFREAPLRVTIIAAVFLIVGQAVFASFDLAEKFAKQGNDDVMRLVMVRDLIAGQGWFDVVQYRVLPPEGMPLHWSRYVDAAIAAIILPLSYIVSMPTAELLGAMIWPAMIQLIALAVVAMGTRRLFGTYAACFAVLSLVLWPVTGSWHAGPGNLDHHNIQMLMMMVMALSAVWPDRSVASGLVGGLAAAFSLAVGLEALIFVIAVGVVFFARSFLSASTASRMALMTFCGALSVGSVLFWLGQTAPAERMMPMCDRLSPTVLSVIWTATIASTLPLLLWPSGRRPLQHLFVTALISAGGIVLAWPMLITCLTGPYGDLPQELQDFISRGVGEALPLWLFTQQNPLDAAPMILPVLLTLGTITYFVIEDLSTKRMSFTGEQFVVFAGLGFLCIVGVLMSLYQMRAITMSAAIIPLFVGFILARMFRAYFEQRDATMALLGLVFATLLISPGTVTPALAPLLPEEPEDPPGIGDCRSYASVLALNAVPKAVILPHFNLAPHILWLTHHDVLSGGYHTSAEALFNAVTPFGMEEEELREHLAESGATHFLLCANTSYSGEFVSALAAGEEVDWLRSVSLDDDNQVLLEVVTE